MGALLLTAVCVRSSAQRRLFSELTEFTENILGNFYALRYQSFIRIFFYFTLVSGVGFLFPSLTYNAPSEIVYPFFLSITAMGFLG